jgi:hypothetical protein
MSDTRDRVRARRTRAFNARNRLTFCAESVDVWFPSGGVGDWSSKGGHPLPGRFLANCVAVVTLALVCAPSAAAVSITFDGEVLRYREYHHEGPGLGLTLGPSPKAPKYFRIGMHSSSLPTVHVGRGCERQIYPDPNVLEVLCPLGTVPTGRLRYRLSLGASWDSATVGSDDNTVNGAFPIRGVIYGGPDSDAVYGAGDRIYGGPGGDDNLEGRRVYGGEGNDYIFGRSEASVLHGGPGNDEFNGDGSFFGGPGNDLFDENDTYANRASDVLVGGRGRDRIELGTDRRKDVIRLHGLGSDRVICDRPADPSDVLFVDRSDRLDPSCKDATVLYTERPRYPYP